MANFIRRLMSANITGSQFIKKEVGNKAFLTLKWESVNNSMTLANDIIATLTEWENNSNVDSIVFHFTGNTLRSGIDLRGHGNAAENRFVSTTTEVIRSNYKLSYKLGTLKKPNATIINGSLYSSTSGILQNHTYIVCTENAVFAMPETAHGLVPGCLYIARLPHKLGLYLALTGRCLKGRDLYNAGLATHYIRAAKLKKFKDDLKKVDNIDSVIGGIYRYRKFGENYKIETIPDFHLIYELMNKSNSVDDIVAHLENRGDEWSKKQLSVFSQRDPLALKLTFKLFGTLECDLKQCLKLRYRLTKRLMARKEHLQSLRSDVADKESKHNWVTTIQQIDEQTVNSFFEPIPDELQLD